ncbi:uncharacterized protein LOC124366646 [Homalodisca vitripennis]|uniref:uncharacterized protein LOC124366646 n=1 Tax=Homalodisca vitripennis TaxID=197043 RepID=UPI001EEA12C7|nr:uncharacterized protein LOC124366646 [Homalodisca vitripennis]
MGPELGSPLLDSGSHCHPADWSYRDKCLMLHTITQRFLEEDTNPSLVLQDILLDFPIGDYNEVYLEDCKYPSDDMKVEIVSEEIEDIHQSQIKEESDEGQSEVLIHVNCAYWTDLFSIEINADIYCCNYGKVFPRQNHCCRFKGSFDTKTIHINNLEINILLDKYNTSST